MSIYYSRLTGSAWGKAIELAQDVLQSHGPQCLVEEVLSTSDPSLSVSVFDGGELVGAYFLSRNKFCGTLFSDLTAICGKGLFLKPAYRGQGIGSYLRSLPAKMEVDYVWGQQVKSLTNLDHWLKRRILLADDEGVYVTAEILTEKAIPYFEHYFRDVGRPFPEIKLQDRKSFKPVQLV